MCVSGRGMRVSWEGHLIRELVWDKRNLSLAMFIRDSAEERAGERARRLTGVLGPRTR